MSHLICRNTLLALVVASGVFSFPYAAIAQAPPCGEPLGLSYLGVPALSNGERQNSGLSCGDTDNTRGPFGKRYQCVEYVRRFYDRALNIDTSGWTNLNAKDFIEPRGLAQTGFQPFLNGATVRPRPNDMVVFRQPDQDPYGHIAVITAVTDSQVFVIEQNWGSDAEGILSLTRGAGGSYILTRPGEYRVLGWLRPPTEGGEDGTVVAGRISGEVNRVYRRALSGGFVDGGQTPNGIVVGDAVRVDFTYDPDAEGSIDQNGNALYSFEPAAPFNISVRVNGAETRQVSRLVVAVFDNNFAFGGFQSYFQLIGTGASFDGFPAGEGFLDVYIGTREFRPNPNSLLESTDLPQSLSDLDLDEADFVRLVYRSSSFTNDPGTWYFEALLDPESLTLRVE